MTQPNAGGEGSQLRIDQNLTYAMGATVRESPDGQRYTLIGSGQVLQVIASRQELSVLSGATTENPISVVVPLPDRNLVRRQLVELAISPNSDLVLARFDGSNYGVDTTTHEIEVVGSCSPEEQRIEVPENNARPVLYMILG